MQAEGKDALHWLVLPRALAGIFAVFTLVALSALVSLLLAYLNIYGLSPWAIDAYLHLVGRVFSPEVTLIFAFKTFFFALTVALCRWPRACTIRSTPASAPAPSCSF